MPSVVCTPVKLPYVEFSMNVTPFACFVLVWLHMW